MNCPTCPDSPMVDVPAPFGKGNYLYCRTCKKELAEIQPSTPEALGPAAIQLPDGFRLQFNTSGLAPGRSYKHVGAVGPCFHTRSKEFHRFIKRDPSPGDACACWYVEIRPSSRHS